MTDPNLLTLINIHAPPQIVYKNKKQLHVHINPIQSTNRRKKNINLNKSSEKTYKSKYNNSNLDKYSSANEHGELYNDPNTCNQTILYPDSDIWNQSDFKAPKQNTVLPTTMQHERHNTINESSFSEKIYIPHSSNNKLDTSSYSHTINYLTNISAPYQTQPAYSRKDLWNKNTGIKIKNHNSTNTNLRTNTQTKPSFIPESIFIRSLPPTKITKVTYNIGNNSSHLTTPIQKNHDPISNMISERTVNNCNFEINIPDSKKCIPDNHSFPKSHTSPSTYNRSQEISSEHTNRKKIIEFLNSQQSQT